MFENYRIPGRDSVRKIACFSRFLVFCLQILANFFPDHEADAFTPSNEDNLGSCDFLISSLIDGFHKWDAKYFIYIAEHGYRAENFFAFFPLYPLLLKISASIISNLTGILSFQTACVLSASIINYLCFIEAAIVLYDLTNKIFSSPKFAGLASLLFCFNPASIFFSASYTESIFSMFVFKGLYALNTHNSIQSTMWFMLASMTRSNGTINIGFIGYFCITEIVVELQRKFSILLIIKQLIKCTILCTVIILPYICFNIYAYTTYCMDGYIKIDCKIAPYWCCQMIPSIYDHVQKFHWGLGLFNYYQFKKIPNFILAAPTVVLCFGGVYKYLKKRSNEIYCLGLPIRSITASFTTKHGKLQYLNVNIFCYIIHVAFMVSFAVLFMHVEVVTRMMMSSSPVPYWIAASYIFKDLQGIDSVRIVSVYQHLSQKSKYIVWYFLGYVILGICLHVNYFPWT